MKLVVKLESFEKDKKLKEKQRIEKFLAVLCFLVFAFIGYLSVRYLLF